MRFTGRNLCHTCVILDVLKGLITQIKKAPHNYVPDFYKDLQKPDISTLDNYAFRKEIL